MHGERANLSSPGAIVSLGAGDRVPAVDGGLVGAVMTLPMTSAIGRRSQGPDVVPGGTIGRGGHVDAKEFASGAGIRPTMSTVRFVRPDNHRVFFSPPLPVLVSKRSCLR